METKKIKIKGIAVLYGTNETRIWATYGIGTHKAYLEEAKMRLETNGLTNVQYVECETTITLPKKRKTK